MLGFAGAVLSDVGRVREQNQDAAYLDPTCAVLADGVGGAAAGDVAAATAVHAVAGSVRDRRHEDLAAALQDGISRARERLRAAVEERPECAGMATTLTAVATDGSRFVLAHVGDSRGYVFRDGELTQVTRDHTYVQDQIDAGLLDAEHRWSHPWRHVLMRSVGAAPERDPDAVQADLTELRLVPGDRVLLVSDGLSDVVANSTIAEALGTSDDAAAASTLLEAALEAGAPDNVTCVVASVVAISEATGAQQAGALAVPGNVVGDGSCR